MNAADFQTSKHEAAHCAAAWILLGPDSVGEVSRRPTNRDTGHFAIGDLPIRAVSMNAFDAAIVCLAPLADGAAPDASELDADKAWEMAEIAYRHASAEERAEPLQFGYDWTQRAFRSAIDLVRDARFVRLSGALQRALGRRTTLSASEVREVLEAAEAAPSVTDEEIEELLAGT